MRDQLRVLSKQGRDVGDGAGGHDPGCAGRLGLESSGHGVNGGLSGRSALGLGEKVGAVEAAVAVNVCRRVDGGSLERVAVANIEGDVIVFAKGCQDGGGIVRSVSGKFQS